MCFFNGPTFRICIFICPNCAIHKIWCRLPPRSAGSFSHTHFMLGRVAVTNPKILHCPVLMPSQYSRRWWHFLSYFIYNREKQINSAASMPMSSLIKREHFMCKYYFRKPTWATVACVTLPSISDAERLEPLVPTYYFEYPGAYKGYFESSKCLHVQ